MTKFQTVVVALGASGILAIAMDAAMAEDVRMDIVDTAVSSGQFETLATALTAADLVETLKGDGPFTVFAPTDAAFAKLPAGTVDNLLKAENVDQLTAVLTYHVVAGAVTADQVVTLSEAPTVNGQMVEITVTEAGVMVDGANVVVTDIIASNGVIHVIDSVILPN
jgi:transforming growth factor-beta-induced protein